MPEAKKGDRVSLNKSNRLFFFQEGGIRLVDGVEEIAVIPDSISDEHLKQINMAIRAEQLVLGWPEEKVDAMEKDSEILILLEKGRTSIDNWLGLMRSNKGVKDSVKAMRIEKLIELEKAGKNRKSVIARAETTLSYIGGISKIEETEGEKIEIKLTSGNTENEDNPTEETNGSSTDK